MHNQILDLAGSVRVYVRARPFLKSDGEGAADEVGVPFACGVFQVRLLLPQSGLGTRVVVVWRL